MTMSKAVFYGMLAIALSILAHPRISFILAEPAHAGVGGQGYYALKRDRDFKRAVKSIVENCSFSGRINASGYADGDYVSVDGYLSYGDISC